MSSLSGESNKLKSRSSSRSMPNNKNIINDIDDIDDIDDDDENNDDYNNNNNNNNNDDDDVDNINNSTWNKNISNKIENEEKKEEEEISNVPELPVQISKNNLNKINPWKLNKEDESFLKFYAIAAELQKDFGIELESTEFILVGIQSAGKSSVLSQFIQMPISFVQNQTGTRCPVRYSLSYDKNQNIPEIFIDNIIIKNGKRLPEILQEKMSLLNDNDTFSDECIEVKIKSNRTPYMVIIDLPGFIAEGLDRARKQDSQTIENIAKKYLIAKQNNNSNKYNYTPLIILQTKDIDSELTFDIINRLCSNERKNWKEESVFIFNKFEKYARDGFNDNKQLIQYFDKIFTKVGKNKKNIIITSMNPKEHVLTINTFNNNYDELINYLKNVEIYEKEELDKIFNNIQKNSRNDNDIEINEKIKDIRYNHCGINKMRETLRDIMKDCARRMKNNFKNYIIKPLNTYEINLNNAKKALESINPQVLKQDISEFANTLFDILRKWYDGENLSPDMYDYDTDNNNHNNNNNDLMWCGLLKRYTWKEDIEEFENNFNFDGDNKLNGEAKLWKEHYMKNVENLGKEIEKLGNKECQDYYVKDRIEGRLNGKAQLLRAIRLWHVDVSLLKYKQLKRDHIINLIGALGPNMEGNIWSGVKNVLDIVTKPFEHAYSWLSCYLQFWFIKHAQDAFQFILNCPPQFSHLLNGKNFQHFKKLNMENVLNQILDNYRERVKIYCGQFSNQAKFDRKDVCSCINEHALQGSIQTGNVLGNMEDFYVNNLQNLSVPGDHRSENKDGMDDADEDQDDIKGKIQDDEEFFLFQALNQFGMRHFEHVDPVDLVLSESKAAFILIQWMLLQNVENKVKNIVIEPIIKLAGNLREPVFSGALDREAQVALETLAKRFEISNVTTFKQKIETQLGKEFTSGFNILDEELIAQNCGVDIQQLKEDYNVADQDLKEFEKKVQEAEYQLNELDKVINTSAYPD